MSYVKSRPAATEAVERRIVRALGLERVLDGVAAAEATILRPDVAGRVRVGLGGSAEDAHHAFRALGRRSVRVDDPGHPGHDVIFVGFGNAHVQSRTGAAADETQGQHVIPGVQQDVDRMGLAAGGRIVAPRGKHHGIGYPTGHEIGNGRRVADNFAVQPGTIPALGAKTEPVAVGPRRVDGDEDIGAPPLLDAAQQRRQIQDPIGRRDDMPGERFVAHGQGVGNPGQFRGGHAILPIAGAEDSPGLADAQVRFAAGRPAVQHKPDGVARGHVRHDVVRHAHQIVQRHDGPIALGPDLFRAPQDADAMGRAKGL